MAEQVGGIESFRKTTCDEFLDIVHPKEVFHSSMVEGA